MEAHREALHQAVVGFRHRNRVPDLHPHHLAVGFHLRNPVTSLRHHTQAHRTALHHTAAPHTALPHTAAHLPVLPHTVGTSTVRRAQVHIRLVINYVAV